MSTGDMTPERAGDVLREFLRHMDRSAPDGALWATRADGTVTGVTLPLDALRVLRDVLPSQPVTPWSAT